MSKCGERAGLANQESKFKVTHVIQVIWSRTSNMGRWSRSKNLDHAILKERRGCVIFSYHKNGLWMNGKWMLHCRLANAVSSLLVSSVKICNFSLILFIRGIMRNGRPLSRLCFPMHDKSCEQLAICSKVFWGKKHKLSIICVFFCFQDDFTGTLTRTRKKYRMSSSTDSAALVFCY